MKQPFYVINHTFLQARKMWKLAYVNGKKSLVFICEVFTLKYIEIILGSIKSEASDDGFFYFYCGLLYHTY